MKQKDTRKTHVKEFYKPVVGFEGLYDVSNLGNVRSLYVKKSGEKHSREKKFRVLKKIKSLYLKVTLSKNGKQYQKHIHRLVAEAFIENPDNKEQVNHIDANKYNNNLENLEWVTSKENAQHASSLGLLPKTCLGVFGKDHPSSKSVYQIDKHGNVKKWDSASDAVRDVGADSGGISRSCLGEYDTHKGCVWLFEYDGDFSKIKHRFKPRKKKIIKIGEDGSTKEYESISLVSKDGFSRSSVINCLKGRYKTSGGYRWEYADRSN